MAHGPRTRPPDLPLSRSVATGGGGHMHYRLQRTSAQWPHVVGRKVVGRRALRSSFKSTRDSSMNYTLARCLSSGVQLGLFPTRPRKRCERVCDRAFFHTQGARAPRSKNRRPLDAKGTPLVAGHVVSVNSIRQHAVYHSTRLLTLSCLDTRRAVCVTVWIRLDATHPAAVNPHLSPALQASFDE